MSISPSKIRGQKWRSPLKICCLNTQCLVSMAVIHHNSNCVQLRALLQGDCNLIGWSFCHPLKIALSVWTRIFTPIGLHRWFLTALLSSIYLFFPETPDEKWALIDAMIVRRVQPESWSYPVDRWGSSSRRGLRVTKYTWHKWCFQPFCTFQPFCNFHCGKIWNWCLGLRSRAAQYFHVDCDGESSASRS